MKDSQPSAGKRAVVHLGLPFWSFADWRGGLFPGDARSEDFLAQYARVFDAVEGNTTFYATPDPSTVERWRSQAPKGFRFCFKLPRTITHEAGLRDVQAETWTFLERMAPLEGRLGPFMIQLPPEFGPDRLALLDDFLGELPGEFDYAVELRHPGFFGGHPAEDLANDVLLAHGCDRVVLDSRPLRDGPEVDAATREAFHKKPDLPVREIALGANPLMRLILHPDPAVCERWIERWAEHVARFARAGREPIVFVHTPSNLESPRHLRRFHAALAARIDVAPLAPFPGEAGESASGQLPLFA